MNGKDGRCAFMVNPNLVCDKIITIHSVFCREHMLKCRCGADADHYCALPVLVTKDKPYGYCKEPFCSGNDDKVRSCGAKSVHRINDHKDTIVGWGRR